MKILHLYMNAWNPEIEVVKNMHVFRKPPSYMLMKVNDFTVTLLGAGGWGMNGGPKVCKGAHKLDISSHLTIPFRVVHTRLRLDFLQNWTLTATSVVILEVVFIVHHSFVVVLGGHLAAGSLDVFTDTGVQRFVPCCRDVLRNNRTVPILGYSRCCLNCWVWNITSKLASFMTSNK